MDCGIIGLGTYIPKYYMSAAEIAQQTNIPEDVIKEKFGVNKKTIPGPEDIPSYMGIQAANQAIKNAGIAPQEIDIVIWTGSQFKDYLCWLASVKVAYEIGAKNAWAFDMSAMCGSMMVGMETAKSLMFANEKYNTVLLVSGYRLADLINLKNADTSFMFDLAAGGAAMILRKNHSKNIVLGSATKIDGSFSENCIVEYGAAKHWPIKTEDIPKIYMSIKDVASFKERLKQTTMSNFYGVIRKALQNSNLTQADIDYLAILHFKKSAHDAVLKELNLDAQQTTYLDNYGHMGQNDQILSIELGLREGKIKNGDNVVMVGSGLGFVWSATVVRWG
jgi:3-oxoacyl-[acyl-carrier-protein] synthase-3